MLSVAFYLVLCMSVIMLTAEYVMMNVIMLSVTLLSVILWNVILTSVILLSVVLQNVNVVECRYSKYHGANLPLVS
jgi:hypothetical protein